MKSKIIILVVLVVCVVAAFLFLGNKNNNNTVNVNGVNLSVQVVGSGQPIILIHGLGYSKESMYPLVQHLQPNYRVISYDVRGHGQSDKPESFTLDDHADDLYALIRKYKLKKPIVIGFSMGSYIALKTAEKYPDTFDKIVLIGTKGGGTTSSSQQYASNAGSIMSRVFAPTTSQESIASYAKNSTSSVQLSDSQRNAIYKSLTNFDLLNDAGRVNTPVLLLTGEYDGLNPPAAAMSVADALPNAEFYVVPNAGHIAFFENPDFVYEHIDEFLKQ